MILLDFSVYRESHLDSLESSLSKNCRLDLTCCTLQRCSTLYKHDSESVQLVTVAVCEWGGLVRRSLSLVDRGLG